MFYLRYFSFVTIRYHDIFVATNTIADTTRILSLLLQFCSVHLPSRARSFSQLASRSCSQLASRMISTEGSLNINTTRPHSPSRLAPFPLVLHALQVAMVLLMVPFHLLSRASRLASRRYSQLIGGLPKARAYCRHSPLTLIAVMRWAPSCRHLRKLGPRPHKAPEATWTLLVHTERPRTEALAGRTYLLLVPNMLAGNVSSMCVRCY